MAKRSGGLWREFGGWIVLVAAVGVALALWADRPGMDPETGFVDAVREIGGALVAGAVLAGLVVWFEDRREDERVDREMARDDRLVEREDRRADEAARAAWQREIDVQLVGALGGRLPTARDWYVQDLEERADPSHALNTYRTSGSRPAVGSVEDIAQEIRTLLAFRRDQRIGDAFEVWDRARRCLEYDAETASGARIAHLHHELAPAEQVAWAKLMKAVVAYIDTHYPID